MTEHLRAASIDTHFGSSLLLTYAMMLLAGLGSMVGWIVRQEAGDARCLGVVPIQVVDKARAPGLSLGC